MHKTAPTSRLQFMLLGPPEIYLDGEICHDPVGVKDRALLFYLATTERGHGRQALATLLWGDKAETSARANLRKSLQRLRTSFGDFLDIDAGPPYHVGLHPRTDWWVDTAVLLSGTERGGGNAVAITEALALYRGDFLSGFFVTGAPDFEAWMRAERARLRDLFQQHLRVHAAWCEEQGDLDTAILLCRRILELEPWREEVHRLMMRLLVQNGERSVALAQYKICVEVLERELDVPPGTATNDLYEQILHDTADSGELAVSINSIQDQHLPVPRTSFVGREQELREIAHYLQRTYLRLLTITGPGGVGKTRLALTAAEQNRERYRDGAWYVPLAVIDSPDYIPSAIASALGITLEGSGHVIDQVVAHLQERELLLVLDNFEHLLPDVSHLTAILEAAPTVTVLVTSRERLQLYAEHCYEISGLSTSSPPACGEATESDAVELFLQRAEQQRTHFEPTGEDVKTIVQICDLVDGLPLGIELAASWIGFLSCPMILQELHNNLNDFPSTFRDVSERHQSLRAVIHHSWKLLSSPERRVLRGLAVFRGGFDLEAAKAVTDASILQLSSLTRKSLLQLQDAERYRLHESVRQYAEHQLRIKGEEADSKEKHLRYFISLARTGNDALLTAEQIPWLLRLEKEHDNLRTALSWSHNSAHIPDAGIQMLSNLGWYWYFGGHWQEGYDWVGNVLQDDTPYGATQEYVKALYIAGGLATALDQYDQAMRFLDKSIETSRQSNNREGLAFALSIVTFVYLYTAQYREAKSAALESVAIFEELHHQPGCRWALGALGEVFLFAGEYEEARTVFEKCVSAHEPIGITTLLPHALVHLGKTERYIGDYQRAHQHLREGLTIARELRAQRFTAQALQGLSMIALHDNDVVHAAANIREAIILFHRLGDGMGQADCLDTAAIVFSKAARYEIATRVFGASNSFRNEIGVPVPAGDRQVYTDSTQFLQQVLGRERFNLLWSEWRPLSHQQVVIRCVNRLSSID